MSLTKARKPLVTGISALVLSLALFTGVASAEGEGLNGIGQTEPTVTETQPTQPAPTPATQPTTQQPVTQTPPPASTPPSSEEPSGAEVIGNLWGEVGVDNEASQKASQMMNPIAQVVNVIFAVILSIATLGMFLITALDLLYIAFPPIRNLLYAGGAQQQQGGMGGGMMGGGMGMGGYGGMRGGMMGGGMMGGGAQPQQSSFLGQFISDEAVAAVQAGQPQQGGGMMGGMGMGMMGGGMMGGGAQPQPTKSIIVTYLKKRVIFLALFGVCAVLLSTTIFTDLGVQIGSWILNRLMGIEQNFPE